MRRRTSDRAQFYTTEQLGPRQEQTPEGFLVCYDVPLARTGMMIYGPNETPLAAGPEGIVKIFREEEDVFRPETIASALGKPVTNEHPDEDVIPDLWKELTHGVALNIRRGEAGADDLLLADLMITTPEGIEAVRSGKREISLGYEADYVEVEPGVGRQANIIINHIALVEQGRCGPRCAIKDHKPDIDLTEDKPMAQKRSKFTDKITSLLRRAYRAKDSAELEEITEEAKDAFPDALPDAEEKKEDEDIHIHLDDEDFPGGRTTFSDEDLQALIDQNAAEHKELFSRIEALEKQLAGTTDEDLEGAGDQTAMEEAMLDELPEELQAEAGTARDSRYLGEVYRETVSMAEVLAPGIKYGTFDSAANPVQTFKRICGLRRKALDQAYADPATSGVISELLVGKKLDTRRMTCDAVRVLFRGAFAAKRQANNSATRDSGMGFSSQKEQKKGVTSIAELNKLNAERYS